MRNEKEESLPFIGLGGIRNPWFGGVVWYIPGTGGTLIVAGACVCDGFVKPPPNLTLLACGFGFPV